MAMWTRLNLRRRELDTLMDAGLLCPLTATEEWKLSEPTEESPALPQLHRLVRALPRARTGQAGDFLCSLLFRSLQAVLIVCYPYNLTGEIEDQLRIFEDLAPNWISKKVPGGEILYRQVL